MTAVGRHTSRLAAAGLVAAAFGCFSGAAAAQEVTTGIAADRFVPGVGPLVFLGSEAAETTPVRSLACAVSLSAIGNPIRLANGVTGARFSVPVRTAVGLTVALETGIWRRIAGAIIVPLTIWQEGDRLRGTGVDDRPLAPSAGGDLGLRLKAAFIGDPARAGLHLAALLHVTVPAGKSQFAASDGVTVEPRLIADYRAGRFLAGVAAGVRFSPDRKLFGSAFGDELTYSLAASYAVVERARFTLTPIIEAQGAVGPSAAARPVELRGAARVRISRVLVDAGGGAGLTDAAGAPSWRVFVAVRGILGGD